MSIPLALLLLSHSGPTILDQSVAAFQARKSFTVSIALDATLDKKVTSARYWLGYTEPGKVLLSKLSGGKPTLTFWLDGSTFIAFDPTVNEAVVRKVDVTGQILDRMITAMGGVGLDDPVSAQLSPDAMATFLYRFRSVQGWSTTTGNGKIAMTRNAVVNGAKTHTELDFSASSKLLTRALLVGPKSRLLWAFKYGSRPASISFKLPAGVNKVTALTEHAHVQASDANAKNVVDRSLRSYARLDSLSYSVSGPDGQSENWMDGSSFREKQSRIDWSYVQGQLVIHDLVKGAFYRGRCKSHLVSSYLSLFKCPMDPVLQSLMAHQNPIKGWFLPGMTAASRGRVNVSGSVADAVELNSRKLQVSLLIRADNGLVTSAASRIKDAGGKIVSDSQREFKYWSVNKPIAATTFEISAQSYSPLPRLPKE